MHMHTHQRVKIPHNSQRIWSEVSKFLKALMRKTQTNEMTSFTCHTPNFFKTSTFIITTFDITFKAYDNHSFVPSVTMNMVSA
jgi:hypothetical protein